MDIFWSPAFPTADTFAEHNMLFRQPEALSAEGLFNSQIDSPDDSTVRCAFHNVFVVRSPVSANVVLRNGKFETSDTRLRLASQLFQPAVPIRPGFVRMRFGLQYVFFSPESVTALLTGAHFHQTEIQAKFIFTPRSFDISRILLPIDTAFEFNPSINQFQFREGDPLYYVRFETTEPVRLRRFRLSSEMIDVIKACMSFSSFRPRSSLEDFYQAFVSTNFAARVSKLVLKNVVDEGD